MVIHWGGYVVHCNRAWFRQPSHCTKSIIKLNREPFSAWISPDHEDDNTGDLLKFKHKEKDGFYSLLKAGDPAYSRKGSWRPEGGRGAHQHHQPASVPAPHSSAQKVTKACTIAVTKAWKMFLWVLTLSWVFKSDFIFARVFTKLLFPPQIDKENHYELPVFLPSSFHGNRV